MLDRGFIELYQSLFNMDVAIREPRAALRLRCILNYYRRGFFVAEGFENFSDARIHGLL